MSTSNRIPATLGVPVISRKSTGTEFSLTFRALRADPKLTRPLRSDASPVAVVMTLQSKNSSVPVVLSDFDDNLEAVSSAGESLNPEFSAALTEASLRGASVDLSGGVAIEGSVIFGVPSGTSLQEIRLRTFDGEYKTVMVAVSPASFRK